MLSNLNSREEEFFEIWRLESNLEMLFADHISNIEELLVKLPRLIYFLMGICSQSNSFEKKLESNLFFWIFLWSRSRVTLLSWQFVVFGFCFVLGLLSCHAGFLNRGQDRLLVTMVLPRDLEELRSQSWAFSLFVGMKRWQFFFFFFWRCSPIWRNKKTTKKYFLVPRSSFWSNG